MSRASLNPASADRLGTVAIGDAFENGFQIGKRWKVRRVDGDVIHLWHCTTPQVVTRGQLLRGPWRRWPVAGPS